MATRTNLGTTMNVCAVCLAVDAVCDWCDFGLSRIAMFDETPDGVRSAHHDHACIGHATEYAPTYSTADAAVVLRK